IEGGSVGGGGPTGAGSYGTGPAGGGGGGRAPSPVPDCSTGGGATGVATSAAAATSAGAARARAGRALPRSPRQRRYPIVISATAQISELGRKVNTSSTITAPNTSRAIPNHEAPEPTLASSRWAIDSCSVSSRMRSQPAT